MRPRSRWHVIEELPLRWPHRRCCEQRRVPASLQRGYAGWAKSPTALPSATTSHRPTRGALEKLGIKPTGDSSKHVGRTKLGGSGDIRWPVGKDSQNADGRSGEIWQNKASPQQSQIAGHAAWYGLNGTRS